MLKKTQVFLTREVLELSGYVIHPKALKIKQSIKNA